MHARSWLFFGAVAFLIGCGGSGNHMQTAADMAQSTCTHTVPCTSQSQSQLSLFQPVNSATIGNTNNAGVFTSTLDASAGGLTPSDAYVYAKFTDQGLINAAVGDIDALASSDWDIAFRRFIIRLNSGVSGPSCVTGARTATGTTFDGLTAVPDGLDFNAEQYFTDSCDYVPDGSGLMSPGTVLQSFWEYPGCLKMTGNIFVLALADGRHVKLVVQDYYVAASQMMCNTSGTIPEPSGAANYQIEWAIL